MCCSEVKYPTDFTQILTTYKRLDIYWLEKKCASVMMGAPWMWSCSDGYGWSLPVHLWPQRLYDIGCSQASRAMMTVQRLIHERLYECMKVPYKKASAGEQIVWCLSEKARAIWTAQDQILYICILREASFGKSQMLMCMRTECVIFVWLNAEVVTL